MLNKPSNHENEYFALEEFKRRKELEVSRREEMAEDEKERLKELHHMHCPKCGMKLLEINYKGMRVDKCSGCSGIWLDEGELENIVKKEDSRFNAFAELFTP